MLKSIIFPAKLDYPFLPGEVEDTKYFGVILSDNLDWSKHITTATTKANARLSFIKRNLKDCPKTLKELAYFSLVRSFTDYCSTVWDPHQKHNHDRLKMVQRRAARFVKSKYKRTESVTAMLNELGWHSLSKRREDARLILFYKIINNLAKNNSSLIAEVKQIDSDICDSHHNERLFDEHEATSKIASDPKFFYKFAKRSSKTKTNIGPLLANDNTLSDDPKVVSELLLHQYNRVFSVPLATHAISDPFFFFINPAPQTNCLSSILVNDELIVDVIKELSCNSAAGPVIPIALLKNASVELAKPLNILFNHF